MAPSSNLLAAEKPKAANTTGTVNRCKLASPVAFLVLGVMFGLTMLYSPYRWVRVKTLRVR